MMDFDFQTLMYIALAILFLVFSGARRRKPERRAPDTNQDVNVPRGTNTEANVQSESELVLPPFMQNFEGLDADEGMLEETIENEPEELPMVTEQTEPETVQEPESRAIVPPVPVDSPTNLPSKPFPITSLIDLSPETFRQGIILSEILGRPKGIRNRK
jgi:hypothetical protein